MDIAIPFPAAGVLTLLAFFAPYAIGALNGVLPFVKTPLQKKIVSVIVSIALAAVVMVFYYAMTGASLEAWPVFILLAIGIVQLSYGLVTKSGAAAVERATETPQRVDGAHNVKD